MKIKQIALIAALAPTATANAECPPIPDLTCTVSKTRMTHKTMGESEGATGDIVKIRDGHFLGRDRSRPLFCISSDFIAKTYTDKFQRLLSLSGDLSAGILVIYSPEWTRTRYLVCEKE